MSSFLSDLRGAIRFLRHHPGFTLTSILTLALGIGANTAIFSLLNAVLIRPLPYERPNELVLIWESAPFFGLRDSPVSPANYVDWKTRSGSFQEMGALEDRSYRLMGDGTPEVVRGAVVTAGLFRVLGTRAALGRVFQDTDDRPGAEKVAVISDGFWRRRFAARREVIGQTVLLDDEKHTIIGVLAPGAEPPSEYRSELGELWTPLGAAYSPAGWANRGRHNWMVIARLKPEVPLARANAEMQAIGKSLAREYPTTNEQVGAFVAPLREHFVTSSRRLLLILVVTVAFVLLIACSNVANLMLSRAAARAKEVAIRGALGASRWRLARQFLCESLILSAAGGALGLLLAVPAFRFLAHLAPGEVSVLNTVTLDWRVVAFTFSVAALTAVVFGLAPLFQLRRLDLASALKQTARTLAEAPGSRRMRELLICSEVALAFVLLISAGLLMGTFARLRAVDVGCRIDNVLTLRLPPLNTYRGAQRSTAYQREVLRRILAIPGVVSAGVTNHIPLADKGDFSSIRAEGHADSELFHCNSRAAGPGYLSAMGIPVVRGRGLDDHDDQSGLPVVLINQTLANRLWPGQDAVGRRIFFSRGGNAYVIVGVIGDVHQSGLDVPPKPEFYVSTLQSGRAARSLAVRTKGEPHQVAAAVRQAIWSVDPGQPITDIASMEEVLDREVFQRRLQTTLTASFAALALLLAGIGLYGVLSYLVGQQTPEIGLRMALGAASGDLLARFVGHGVRLTAIGIAVGIPTAIAVSRMLSTFLFGVKPTDPATYAAVAALLLATTAVASYLPARRAMQIDPIAALRQE